VVKKLPMESIPDGIALAQSQISYKKGEKNMGTSARYPDELLEGKLSFAYFFCHAQL